MEPKYIRVFYVLEFLVAQVAIFTAWSEIGGQAALDLMHWGWKFGLSLMLGAAIVAYSASIVNASSIWNARSARSLSIIVLLVIVMGAVTYFYYLQEDNGESDESDNAPISSLYFAIPTTNT